MSERLRSSGPAASTEGAAQLEAIGKMLTGDRANVGFTLGENGEVNFGIGETNQDGQLKGKYNAANLALVDTTKDTEREIRSQAAIASAQDEKHQMIRGAASAGGMLGMIGSAVLRAKEETAGASGGIMLLPRIANQLAKNLTTRSKEQQLLGAHDKDTSNRYQDALNRLGQNIEVDGDQVIVHDEAENVRDKKSSKDANDIIFEHNIKQKILQYLAGVPTVLSQSDTEPAAAREALQADISATIAAYNKLVNRDDATRGQFSANNFMQFADAAKNAIEQGASIANVREGLRKVNVIFAEAVSPVPAERMSKIDRVATALHNASHGLLNRDKITSAATVATSVISAAGQFGAVRGAATLASLVNPALGGVASAATVGAFAGVAEARRATEERKRAEQQVAFGEGGRVSQEVKDSLIKTKNALEITHNLELDIKAVGDVLRAQRDFARTGEGERPILSAEKRSEIIDQLAEIDQRIRDQVANKTALFNFSNRESAEKEFWTMRRRRTAVQDLLANYDAAQMAAFGSAEFKQALIDTREQVSQELATQLAARQEVDTFGKERELANKVFNQLRAKRAVKAGVTSGLMVGAFSLANPAISKIFGDGTALARGASFLATTAMLAPNSIRLSKQILARTEHESQSSKAATEVAAKESQQATKQLLGTAQIDGARPNITMATNSAAPANAGGTSSIDVSQLFRNTVEQLASAA
ncbi:MAG: hypothetical protein LBM12_00975 [Candidatus Nomurabacteria bacterium]|jgi:hypothetical protein|nr:hypothetical protein [Candidatus Nomurabacteria bacterium]